MNTSWYLLYVRGLDDENQPKMLPAFPVVGSKVSHLLGASSDEAKMKKDKENPLWEKIQDDARPAWAPDFLRMGFSIMFKRDDLIDILLKLGIRNPETAKDKNGGLPRMKGKKRCLYFDDVYVVAVNPKFRPMYAPVMKKSVTDWWLAAQTRTPPKMAAYIAPGEATVMNGAQRLADVVASILKTPGGYPRRLPGVDDKPILEEIANLISVPDKDMNRGVNPATDGSGSTRGAGMRRYNQ